jgi:hypothetical protein
MGDKAPGIIGEPLGRPTVPQPEVSGVFDHSPGLALA